MSNPKRLVELKQFPIIQFRTIWFAISGFLIAVSVTAIVALGFNPGIDFIGGTSWQVRFGGEVSKEEVAQFLASDTTMQAIGGEWLRQVAVTREVSTNTYSMRFHSVSEETHQKLRAILKEKFGEFEELRFDSIGPAIGKELRDKAIWAAVLVLLGISLYVAYSFREVSYPVTSWKYGVVTLITLFHDVAVTVGLLVVLGKFLHVELDTNSIVAVLVVMGFSVHDTIVVFDRIRENLRLQKSKIDFSAVVNKSVNDTFARSVNTSLTLVIVLVALLLFGPVSLKYFLLPLTVGVVIGTYSSIFVASPLLVVWRGGKK